MGKMTKKDYELIAKAINKAYRASDDTEMFGIQKVVACLSVSLLLDNEQFKQSIFMNACLSLEKKAV